MKLIPNVTYIISCYGEEPFEAKYIKRDRGFYIFEKDSLQMVVRSQYVKVISKANSYP